ncbi:MAG: hypothetical protein E7463_10975 [Ruminococcaceae bacterium]|nr:hypothetical protein [Oscillospiraceae bacterium]
MKQYVSPALTMTLDESARIAELKVPGGVNLISEVKPFAELAFFKLRPAFTNEWVHPIHIDEPEYGVFAGAELSDDGFTLTYTHRDDTIRAEFGIECADEAIIITLNHVESTGEMPARIKFAQVSLVVDADSAATGMSLELEVDGIAVPGIVAEQAAVVLEHLGYDGRRWALTAADKRVLRQQMQKIVQLYTRDIPQMSCAGPFAADDRSKQGSYMMVYGAYLPGSLTPQNLDEWIEILHAIGLTQVDMHGAEDKNFTFGDFKPNPEIFPEGRKSLREMVQRLKSEGISSILHTYSSQISPKSSFMTPVPDKRLGYNRTFTLTADVDAEATELPILEDVAEISLVHTGHYNSSTYVVWDDEIIQFTELGEHSLKGCIRGAYGTTPAAHKAGTPGRNLKRMYNIFAPDVGGSLFDQVARESAICANECGFDAFYFDALEATVVLEGRDLMDYWNTRFVYDVAKYCGRSVGMEMSSMSHGLWFARSRMGAWDRPSRAHKQFLIRHAEVNRRAQAKNLMPQNLGWWYLGKNMPSKSSEWERMTTDVFETMGRLGAANNFSLSFQGLTVQDWKGSEEIHRIGDRIRRWEQLRLSGTLTEAECAAIADQECHMEPSGVYACTYPEAVASFENGTAEVVIENPYGEQQPFLLRMEPLYARSNAAEEEKEVFDLNSMVDPGAGKLGGAGAANTKEYYMLDGVKADDLLKFTSRTVEASICDEDSEHGPALAITAKAEKNLGVARFERRFAEPVNIAGQYGCGVWVNGDGKGEVLNFQLRCHKLYSDAIDEKLVKVDFTGWRYIELIESSAKDTMGYLWPYYHRMMPGHEEFAPVGYEVKTSEWPDSMYLTPVEANPHHLTGNVPDYTRIAYASVWINNMPAGETCQVKVAGWHSFFTKPSEVADVTLASECGSVQLTGQLRTDCIAEYSDGAGTPCLGEAVTENSVKPSWYCSGEDSRTIDTCRAEGMLTLKPGLNRLTLRADAKNGARMRVVCGVQAEKPVITR